MSQNGAVSHMPLTQKHSAYTVYASKCIYTHPYPMEGQGRNPLNQRRAAGQSFLSAFLFQSSAVCCVTVHKEKNTLAMTGHGLSLV